MPGGVIVASELDAGVGGAVIDFYFQFKYKIAIFFIGNEEGIGAVDDGGAEDGSVINDVVSVAGYFPPSIEWFAVEKAGKTVALCLYVYEADAKQDDNQ